MDHLIEILICLWAVISILYQFDLPRLKGMVSHIDIASLSPMYHFFAPNPPRGDYRILYRRRTDQDVSSWCLFDPVPKRRFYNAVWNPFKRLRKGHFDLTVGMCNELRDLQAAGMETDYVQLSIPYLSISHGVTSFVRSFSEAPKEVQFAITLHNNKHAGEGRLLFRSKWMDL